MLALSDDKKWENYDLSNFPIHFLDLQELFSQQM